jgi:S-DNA-T family DNA segregation ATPase FtsK/SpoIIIE
MRRVLAALGLGALTLALVTPGSGAAISTTGSTTPSTSTTLPSAGSTGSATPGTEGEVFSLNARADAEDEQFIGTGLPVVPNGELLFLSPSSTQATLGPATSQAYASGPYPGGLVVSLPSTINGLGSGSLPPAPGYPFYVASSDPTTPTASQQVGPYSISASSTPDASTAEADVGLQTQSPQAVSIDTHAAVSLDATTGDMEATATDDIAPFAVNALLRVGEIKSSATMTYNPADPSAGVTKSTSFSVGTITIAGVEVGLTAKGLTVGGTTLLPVDLSSLEQQLSASGVSITYIPPTQTATSISSATLDMTYKTVLPAPLLDTTVELTLGSVSTTLEPGSAGTSSTAPVATSPSTPVTIPTGQGSVALPPVSSSAGSSVSSPVSSPVISGPTATASAAPVPPASAPVGSGVAAPVLTTLAASPVGLADLFPLLVLGAAIALGASRLIQWLRFRVRVDGL